MTLIMFRLWSIQYFILKGRSGSAAIYSCQNLSFREDLFEAGLVILDIGTGAFHDEMGCRHSGMLITLTS